MKPSMITRLTQMESRLADVGSLLSSQDVVKDMGAYRSLNREHAELSHSVEQFHAWQQCQQDLEAARAMRADPDMREFAEEEIAANQTRIAELEARLQRLLLPKDPNDARNVIMEIRAGTGGDESALFAGDISRMYLRYCERIGWKTELLSESPSDLGGYKEIIFRIEGDNVFGRLKFESGGHRVQRVPVTETQGRIHTSACTVAVMAEADEVDDVALNPEDLRIDVYRASGAGGQHVNKTESAVRITHLPTGLVAECQDDRSQHRNKDKAMKVLVARVQDMQNRAAQAKEAEHRRSLIGSGDRSERIRTYNFPQGRMTDHRINLTMYKLAYLLEGDLGEMLDSLEAADQAEQLAALGE
jgi:peptide chain release factor 1